MDLSKGPGLKTAVGAFHQAAESVLTVWAEVNWAFCDGAPPVVRNSDIF